jgi:signal transduction histidine kinase
MVVEVEDNGVGIEVEDVGRVFEPFFTTKAADRGTGLGLSISYAIVKNHGGEITCESVRGEGTVFRVMLPVEENTEV